MTDKPENRGESPIPTEHANMVRRGRSKWLKIIGLGFLVLIPTGTYFSCFHQYHLEFENEGWTFHMSFYPFRCIHCTGRIEKLEYRGQPLILPKAPEAVTWKEMELITPVGSFNWYADQDFLAIIGPGNFVRTPTIAPIQAEDLERGYYDLLTSEHDWVESRHGRQGTPQNWYALITADVARWIAPGRMSEFTAWPTTQPTATSQP